MSSQKCHLNGIRRMRDSEPGGSPKTNKLRQESSECYAKLFHGMSLHCTLLGFPATFTIPKLKGNGKRESDMVKVEGGSSLLSEPSKVEPLKFQTCPKMSKAEGHYSRLNMSLSNGHSHSARTQNSQKGNDSGGAFQGDLSTGSYLSISDPLLPSSDSGQESNPGSSDSPPSGNENAGFKGIGIGNDDSGYDIHQPNGNDKVAMIPLEGSPSPTHLMGTFALGGTNPSHSTITPPDYDYEIDYDHDQDILIIGLSEEEQLEIINGFPPTRPGYGYRFDD